MSVSPSKQTSPSLSGRNRLASNSCELVRLTSDTPNNTVFVQTIRDAGNVERDLHNWSLLCIYRCDIWIDLFVCFTYRDGPMFWWRQWRPTVMHSTNSLNVTVAKTCHWSVVVTTSLSTFPVSTKNPWTRLPWARRATVKSESTVQLSVWEWLTRLVCFCAVLLIFL